MGRWIWIGVTAVATGVRELTGGPCARFWSRVRDSLDGVEVSVITNVGDSSPVGNTLLEFWPVSAATPLRSFEFALY